MAVGRYRKRDVKYKKNPPPPYHMRFGRLVLDQQTGFPSREDELIQDEWGLYVDPKYGGYDTNDQDDFDIGR